MRCIVFVHHHLLGFGQGNTWQTPLPEPCGWVLSANKRALQISDIGIHTGRIHLEVVPEGETPTVQYLLPPEVDRTVEMIIEDDFFVLLDSPPGEATVFSPGSRVGRYQVRMRAWDRGPTDFVGLSDENWQPDLTYLEGQEQYLGGQEQC